MYIFPDRPGLRNPELVSKMQEKLKMVLKNILVPQHPEHSSIFRELLTIIHDLRTLNTLHTEKFLQQSRVDSAVPGAGLQQHLLYASSNGDWEEQGDRDSTGSRSPQSSDCGLTAQHSSWEDMRRSPIGSVSSSESLGSETGQTFSRLSVNDLKIHGVGSVLLNALTSPAVSAPSSVTRKRDISRCGSEGSLLQHRQEEVTAATVAATEPAKCPFKARKLESPSDSGIDSPKAQGSQSTNTSVCSSPRSSMEEKVKEVEEEQAKPEVRGDSLEEQHPLLKRALQQPPQPYNTGGVSGFQDEVYKPHKKFRHSGRKDSDEPTSTQESATSPTSEPSQAASHSILASQLAAPPSYSTLSTSGPQSLLASTLSRPIAVPRPKEAEKRNEWLANFILEKGRPAPGPSQSLLMCAPLPAHSNIPGFDSTPWARAAATSTALSAPPAPRHIPVPVAPTPSSSPRTAPGPAPVKSEASKNPQLKLALSGLPPTYEAPLNLSTKSTKSASPPADIPAEA